MTKERHPEVGLDVVQAIREQLEQSVEDPPAALLEHLRQKLVEKALDPKSFYLSVD